MTIAENLKRLRKAAGLSQADLAKKVGISRGAYSLYETGARNPKWETIWKFANALNVEYFDIVDIEEDEAFQKDIDEYILHAPYMSNYEAERQAFVIQEIFFQLNHEGMEKVVEYALDIAENPKYKATFTALQEGQTPSSPK